MAWYLTTPHFQKLHFKDGTQDDVTGLGLTFTRDFDGTWYGTAQAGGAAWGKAGTFSYGLVGVVGRPRMNGVRLGLARRRRGAPRAAAGWTCAAARSAAARCGRNGKASCPRTACA